MKSLFWFLSAALLAAVFATLAPFPGAFAAEEDPQPAAGKDEEVDINLANLMLPDVATLLSQLLNKPVALGSNINRNVAISIAAPRPVAREEAAQLLINELKQCDVCLVPVRDAKQALTGYVATDTVRALAGDIPTIRRRSELPRLTTMVTYAREVYNTSALDLSLSLRAHCSNNARLSADDGSRTLFITDFSDRIESLMDLLDAIDPEPDWNAPCEIAARLSRNDNATPESDSLLCTVLGLNASATWKQLAKGGDTWYDATLRVVPRATQGTDNAILVDYYMLLPVSNSNSRQGLTFNGTLKFDNHDMQRTLSFTIGSDRFTVTLQWMK